MLTFGFEDSVSLSLKGYSSFWHLVPIAGDQKVELRLNANGVIFSCLVYRTVGN